MVKIWEDFEKSCVTYLQSKFGTYAQFIWKGKSISTTSDIEAVTKSGKSFYIEAKHCPAQCGQFVLLPNIKTQSFDYSQLNVTPINQYSQAIIEHMNMDFQAFKEAGTKGKAIEIENSSQIFADWIKNYYKTKKAEYIITNNFDIFSIDDIKYVFEISATYRVKRSGSRNVGSGKMGIVKQFINKNYTVNSLHCSGERLFVGSTIELHNERFVLNGTEYMFSKRENVYEIRRLSNTFNANVIFSVDFNPKINPISNNEFINLLTR